MLEPIHVTIPADPSDPRAPLPDLPGVVVHRGPPLHPDDVCVVNGLRTTSISRTLIDIAEVMPEWEVREVWRRAQYQGRLDAAALSASRARVEWRPSLGLVDRLMDEFLD